MYIYANGNEYKGAVQFINGVPYDAAGQQLVYTETASPNSGLEAGNESGRMQEAGEAEQTNRTESEMFGLDLSPNLRDEGAGFFKTLFTAGSNLSTDALQELDYIAQAVSNPIDTGEAVLRVLAGYAQKALPDDWEAYLPEDWATNKMYANAINDYYAEKYGSLEQAADSFAEQPISVALDALAIKAIMTTISKQAAKKAAVTSEMAKTAKGTVMEGELASRAASELKVAQELERTVKYEGKLVWDEALGAYVPESSVVKPKIDSAEVAPVVAAIEDAVPNNKPAVANVAEDASEAAALARTNEAAKIGEELKSAWLAGADDFFSSVKGNDGMLAATRNQEVAAALAAQADDIAATARRTSDDAAMAAAVQDDLFKNASPAAYENYQASRLAALADDTALATTAPRGMMASKVTGPISRTKDIDIPPVVPRTLTSKPAGPISRTKNIDIPPPRLTAKPESASRGFKDLEINPSRVLPAAQRVAAAASQTGLQGDRDIDGSLIPIAPDKGIDLGNTNPDIGIRNDSPPDVKIPEVKVSEKPGWYQGVSKDDDDDGNYWSADFEDEHWNTPAGVQEAIGIWGRPVGNRIGQRFN